MTWQKNSQATTYIITITDKEGWEARAVENVMKQDIHKRHPRKLKWMVVTPKYNAKINMFSDLFLGSMLMPPHKVDDVPYSFTNCLTRALRGMSSHTYNIIFYNGDYDIDESAMYNLLKDRPHKYKGGAICYKPDSNEGIKKIPHGYFDFSLALVSHKHIKSSLPASDDKELLRNLYYNGGKFYSYGSGSSKKHNSMSK